MTEFYVEEMTHTEDLRQLVLSYFPGLDIPGDAVEGVIKCVCILHIWFWEVCSYEFFTGV